MLISTQSLSNRLEAELENQEIVSRKMRVVMELQLIKKFSDGSANAIVEHVLGNIVKSLCNVACIKKDKFDSFPK